MCAACAARADGRALVACIFTLASGSGASDICQQARHGRSWRLFDWLPPALTTVDCGDGRGGPERRLGRRAALQTRKARPAPNDVRLWVKFHVSPFTEHGLDTRSIPSPR